MRITQAYVSKSVMDFPFHQVYGLDDYNHCANPAVFFGQYRYEDFCMYTQHDTDFKIFWTGQDALTFPFDAFQPKGIENVTAHPKVCKFIADKGYYCRLVKPAAFLNSIAPQKLGLKIYAYCPASAPDYHGKKVLDELTEMGYQIIIGDGRYSQQEWRDKQADIAYQGIFIGLCLSEFAGGGGSIIEMGLRGIKVVTNVFNLPNCLLWTDAQSVAKLIEIEKVNIGYTNKRLATDVWHDLDHEFKWLEI